MSKTLKQIEAYCIDLAKFSVDSGNNMQPVASIITDGEGHLTLFFDKRLSHEQKVRLMMDATQFTIEGINRESNEMKNAKHLKPGEYRQVD